LDPALKATAVSESLSLMVNSTAVRFAGESRIFFQDRLSLISQLKIHNYSFKFALVQQTLCSGNLETYFRGHGELLHRNAEVFDGGRIIGDHQRASHGHGRCRRCRVRVTHVNLLVAAIQV